MKNFWLIPGFPDWGVTAFAWAQLVICFAFFDRCIQTLDEAVFPVPERCRGI